MAIDEDALKAAHEVAERIDIVSELDETRLIIATYFEHANKHSSITGSSGNVLGEVPHLMNIPAMQEIATQNPVDRGTAINKALAAFDKELARCGYSQVEEDLISIGKHIKKNHPRLTD